MKISLTTAANLAKQTKIAEDSAATPSTPPAKKTASAADYMKANEKRAFAPLVAGIARGAAGVGKFLASGAGKAVAGAAGAMAGRAAFGKAEQAGSGQ